MGRGQPTHTSGTTGPKQTINGANTIALDGDTIQIAAGTYTGNNNRNILIDKSITIQGAGQTQTIIDPQNLGRAFTVNPDITVLIKDLTIQNGKYRGELPGWGGAIYNSGNLNVQSCTFKGNQAPGGYSEEGKGGAIYNEGTLTVTSSTFTDNKAQAGGTPSYGGSGGAIYNIDTLKVIGSIFNSNIAAAEGGAINSLNYLTVTGSTFTGNTASLGGAIFCSTPQFNDAIDDVVNYCRIVGNIANQGKDIYVASGPSMDARYNWWGSNFGPGTGRLYGPVIYIPWLTVSITARPIVVYVNQYSTIIADLYTDSAGGNHQAYSAQYPPTILATFYTNLGTIGSHILATELIYGSRSIRNLNNEGSGESINGVDVDGATVQTLVTILDPTTQKEGTIAKAATNTVSMQPTGTPLTILLLAILMVTAGIILPRKRE